MRNRAWNRRLARLLLLLSLLDHKLPLLHFLQHLLRSLHGRLVGIRRRWLFGLGGLVTVIFGCIIVIRIGVIGVRQRILRKAASMGG